MLQGRTILLIVGGGIAAYKSAELIRLIVKSGGAVKVILTKAGREFVTPLTLASLSGEKVYEDLFSLTDETEMGHIELSRAADLVVVAPATADLMAKAANGLANDLASTALLATDKRVLMAPAMNVRMWEHPATQRNLATLTADGVTFVGPNTGNMACGEFGPGRMAGRNSRGDWRDVRHQGHADARANADQGNHRPGAPQGQSSRWQESSRRQACADHRRPDA
jgi:phosphopantothenoylcysteine decarboxylase / phosphopantothenate---cysteine ligase